MRFEIFYLYRIIRFFQFSRVLPKSYVAVSSFPVMNLPIMKSCPCPTSLLHLIPAPSSLTKAPYQRFFTG